MVEIPRFLGLHSTGSGPLGGGGREDSKVPWRGSLTGRQGPPVARQGMGRLTERPTSPTAGWAWDGGCWVGAVGSGTAQRRRTASKMKQLL